MFLSAVVILLIYLNFYKLAFIGLGYLLIKNNSLIKENFDTYLVQKDRFNKYYKKRFPILFYVLPIIGTLSGLGMCYTGYLLNGIYQEILFERVAHFSYKQEIQYLQGLFTLFFLIFFSYIVIDMGIAIYVIQKANTPINKNWQYVMIAGRIIQGTVISVSVIAAGGTAVAGAPEPSPGSNFIHTRTLFGRGWDVEPGDVFTEITAVYWK